MGADDSSLNMDWRQSHLELLVLNIIHAFTHAANFGSAFTTSSAFYALRVWDGSNNTSSICIAPKIQRRWWHQVKTV